MGGCKIAKFVNVFSLESFLLYGSSRLLRVVQYREGLRIIYVHVHVCTDPFFLFQMMKLQSVKSEIRYTPNMILVKLVGSHNISQVILRISDIKRTKMVQYTLVIVIL